MELQVQPLEDFCDKAHRVQCDLLRTDLYDIDIPGNKYFKMKYNIEEMKKRGQTELVTFGGAFSNHIAAVASAGKKYGFGTTGIIRGESSSWHNVTLSKAENQGMKLKFIDRSTYREWKKGNVDLNEFLDMENYYTLPEGGSNVLAVKGCSEITEGVTKKYTIIACPVGTGATLAGLIVSSSKHQKILGFCAVKGGEYLKQDIYQLLEEYDGKYGTNHREKTNWQLETDYHTGGFAKMTKDLFEFYADFQINYNIELDLIYTAKMMLGLHEMGRKGKIASGSNVLAIHTGGQQGNGSMLKKWGNG